MIELCAFVWLPPTHNFSTQQANEFLRSARQTNLSVSISPYFCHNCTPGYNHLPEKLFHFLHMVCASNCLAAIKMDSDGMFCLNHAIIQHEMLPDTYGGFEGLPLHKPVYKKHKIAARVAGFPQNSSYMGSRFYKGPAYIVGRNVACSMSSNTTKFVNTGMEDSSMGIVAMQYHKVHKITFRGSDSHCYQKKDVVKHRCKSFQGLC